MRPPFTVDEFLATIAGYNQAVWPMQVVFYLLAVLLIALAARPSRRTRAIWNGALLAFLWAWMGIVYHWGFHAPINPAGWLFGALFLLQAVALVAEGVARRRLSFRARWDGYGVAGAVMIAYALVVYPVVGALAGHAFPIGPTLGLPCPTTILTFGLLLWSDRRVPATVLVIPVLWSLLGFSAAVHLSMTEDYGLLAAGVVGTLLIVWRNRHGGAPARAIAAA